MKFSVSSYSFQKLLNSGEHTQLSIIRLAKEIGFDAIEFTDLEPQDSMSESEWARALAEECQKQGMPVSNYTICANLLCDDFDKEVERLKSHVDIAVILGAKSMRHDATHGFGDKDKKYKAFDSALPILAEGCRRVTEYAKEKGIETMVENHGVFCQESARVERLVDAVGNPNFGTLVDMGNFMCADEAPAAAVGRMAPMAKYVHAKDFHKKSGNGPNPGDGFFRTRGGDYLRGAVLGHGVVPVYQCIQTLKAAGYDGYISIEFEGVEDNIWALKTGLENLKRYCE